jgi:O-antigen ligase
MLASESILIFILIAAIAYPYRIQTALGPFNSFSIAEMALVAAWCCSAFGWIISRRINRSAKSNYQSIRFGWLDAAILLYVLVNAISILWAIDTNRFVRGIVPILENVALYYLIIVYARTRRRIRLILRLFLALGVVALILSGLYYFWRMEFLEVVPSKDLLLIVSNQTRLGSPAWGASNYYASIMLLFIPTYLCYSILAKSIKARLSFILISAIALVEFFFTFSRGGHIALLIILVLGSILLLKRRNLSLRIAVTPIIVGLLIIAVLVAAYAYFPGIEAALAEINNRVLITDDENTKIRLALLQVAWDSVGDNALGLGVGNYSTIYSLEGMGVHNAYLQIALETGWCGIAITLAMLTMMLRANIRLFASLRHTLYEPFASGLFLAFVAILINILGEATFEGIIFGWIFWLSQGIVRVLSERYRLLQPSMAKINTFNLDQ